MAQVKKDFRKHLKFLKDKRKDVIDSITKICSANAQYSKLLVEALFEEFREAKIERKLSLLFLTDSILKNCKEQYQEPLEDGISEAFCDAYQASMNKPDIRKSLRLLFKTWEPHFSGKTIMAIITNIKLTLGEDINTSLTEEELDSLIEYYRKNGIDPSHLILQKQILQKQMQQESKKSVPKRDVMEVKSSLYVPPDVKEVFTSKPTMEKKAPKPAHPRPEPGQRAPGMVMDDSIRRRNDGEVPHKRSIEIEHIPKKPEIAAAPKRLDAPPTVRKAEGAAPKKPEGESSAYTIKKRKNATDREKHPLDKEEQAFAAIRKSVRPDPNARPDGPARPTETPYSSLGNGGGYGQMRRTPEPTRGPEPKSRSFFGQQQQQPEYEEVPDFSDEEGFQPQPKPGAQPPRQFLHQQQPPPQSQPQFQQQQPPHQHQSQPQTQAQPQSLHPQHSQPHFQQSQPASQQQQQQPLFKPQHGQFSQQSQPHQMHNPQHYQFQPQMQGQYHGQGLDPIQRSGPSQSHSQHQYPPGPFSHQNPSQLQPQYRPPIGTEQSHSRDGRNPQPMHQIPEKDEDKLVQIKKFVEQSLKKDNDPAKFQPEFDPRLPSGPTRVDSFPDPRSMAKNVDEALDYDQGNALIFKSLAQSLKKELPRSIKAKYEYRMGRMGSLGNMVARRDFRIVETLYEELPYRCSSCGMRFGSSGLLNKHLDWHFQFNMEMKEKTKMMNLRNQLITTDHWIRDEGNKNYKTATLENGEDDFEFENYVSSSEEVKCCKACGEPFKEVWDKNKEAWLLDTATKVKYEEEEGGDANKQKSNSYELMHFRCYKLCLQTETK